MRIAQYNYLALRDGFRNAIRHKWPFFGGHRTKFASGEERCFRRGLKCQPPFQQGEEMDIFLADCLRRDANKGSQDIRETSVQSTSLRAASFLRAMQNVRFVAAVAFFLLPCSAVAQAFSTGTGFFFTSDGYVATCYHVIAGSGEIKVRDSAGQIYTASLVLTDIANDLAVIKADVKGVPVLPVRRSSEVRKGNPVFTVGYPNIDMQGADAKVTAGIISSMAGIVGEPNSFQISVAVQPGNSGGPLLDSSGAVIGIVSSKLGQMNALKRSGSFPENVNYAVKSNYLLELVATAPALSAKVVVTPQIGPPEKLSSLVAKVERATVLIIAKQGEQRVSAAEPLPRYWTNITDGSTVEVRLDGNHLHEQGSTDRAAVVCDLERTGERWVGKCVYRTLSGPPCIVEGEEIVTLLTNGRIEGESDEFKKPTGAMCRVRTGRRTPFALTPKFSTALPGNQDQPRPSLPNVGNGKPIYRPQPIFPPDAIRDGIRSGRVVARLDISPGGTVSKVSITESTPPGIFDGAVKETLIYWMFEVARYGYTADIAINFMLDK